MPLTDIRRARAKAASDLRPSAPFFDTSAVRRARVNNFELFYFNDPLWVEKLRNFERLLRFHSAAEVNDLIADLEREYVAKDLV
jgi:hypothetical protein